MPLTTLTLLFEIRTLEEILSAVHHNMDSKSTDDLPPYSESVRSPQQYSLPSNLRQNIAAARSALIESLLTTHIIPHQQVSALSGLASTTLILIPSNVSSLQPPSQTGSKGLPGSEDGFPGETIVGFPSVENLTMVRLHGQENSIEFWRQLAVIQELGQQLRTHLQNSGYQVIRDNETSLHGPNSGSTDWRTVQKEALRDGEVKVRVDLTEICLRVENDMGLYETRTGKAVVVNVDVGG